MDSINNIYKIHDHYKLLECVIACGLPQTLAKLINDNKIVGFEKGQLELVLALLNKNKDFIAKSKNQNTKLNPEITKLLLKIHKEEEKPLFELSDLISFIDIGDTSETMV